MIRKLFMLILLTVSAGTLAACGSENTVLALNPYGDVDWGNVTHARANLHTHTTNSVDDQQAEVMPHEAVDTYNDHGYDILAITDHDHVTYPWTFSELENPFGDQTWEDRDPDALGMVDIVGNELTVTNSGWFPDTVSLFSDYEYNQPESLDGSEEAYLNTLDELAGNEESLMFIAHPGREWKSYEDYAEGDMYSIGWWTDLFDTYATDQLIGIEVYNRYDQYTEDRGLWDAILSETMPGRPVWGLGNDDFHKFNMVGKSYTTQLIDGELSQGSVRSALRNGRFFTSNTKEASVDAPTISKIEVDESARTITIEGDHYDAIQWYHGTDEFYQSTEVGEGETFEYGSFDGNYVRARLIRDEGGSDEAKTLTQPFGFTSEEE